MVGDVDLRFRVGAVVPHSPSRLPVRKFWNAVRPPPAANVNEPCVLLFAFSFFCFEAPTCRPNLKL